MLTKQNKLEKERFNMSNISKANKLQEAIDKLHEADALMQEALGASEECFDLHCAIESVADDIAEYAEQLVEMQITD
jgi:uncharacterized coiled-coil DUF342 family protein